jgi:hypothetical protein
MGSFSGLKTSNFCGSNIKCTGPFPDMLISQYLVLWNFLFMKLHRVSTSRHVESLHLHFVLVLLRGGGCLGLV